MRSPLSLRLTVLLTLPPLLWAGNAVVGRLMVGQVPPLALNALRWAAVLVLLLPLGWRAVATPAARQALARRWRELALLGLLGMGLFNALQYTALTTSTPLNVTLIAASSPVWMLMVGAIWHAEPVSRRALLGAALSLAGVAVVLARGEASRLVQVRFVPGDLWMLLAVVSWAFYTWLLARPGPLMRGAARPPWGWAEFLLVQTLFGAAWAGALAAGEWVLAPQWTMAWTLPVALAVAYVAVGPSLLAYYCWGKGVAAVGPAAAAFFGNLSPLFAALMQAALLAEPPQWHHALAFSLIVAGIFVSTRRRAAAGAATR
jgi:drug/metabolite transporter (DMT)-like permease